MLSSAACSKFNLTLIGPDFTAYKVDDPFRALGPIAIFSARRHWSAPRNIRLQTGSVALAVEQEYQHQQQQQQHQYGASRYYVQPAGADNHNPSRAAQHQRVTVHDSIEYGFQMRGDAPVIVSAVLAGSLADVSWDAGDDENAFILVHVEFE